MQAERAKIQGAQKDSSSLQGEVDKQGLQETASELDHKSLLPGIKSQADCYQDLPCSKTTRKMTSPEGTSINTAQSTECVASLPFTEDVEEEKVRGGQNPSEAQHSIESSQQDLYQEGDFEQSSENTGDQDVPKASKYLHPKMSKAQLKKDCINPLCFKKNGAPPTHKGKNCPFFLNKAYNNRKST